MLRYELSFKCNERLTVIPSNGLAAFYDAACETASPDAAEDSVRLRACGQLTPNFMDQARVSCPQDRIVVSGDHDSVISGEQESRFAIRYILHSRVGFSLDRTVRVLKGVQVAFSLDDDLCTLFTHKVDR